MSILTDELSVVNTMLATIAESPVNTLAAGNIVDVSIARSTIAEVSRKVQAKGWHFNSEEDYPITPDSSGHILLPKNTLRVDVSPLNHPKLDVVQRGLKLYDKKERTLIFKDTIKVSILLLIPFDDLPEVVRQYIMVRATRQFSRRMLGSEVIDSFSASDEIDAWTTLVDEEAETGDYNIFDNYDTASVMQR